jgi:hypothetical protein
VGLALSIFNSITRLLNAPLLAVTTSRVAAAASAEEAAAKLAAAEAEETAAADAAFNHSSSHHHDQQGQQDAAAAECVEAGCLVHGADGQEAEEQLPLLARPRPPSSAAGAPAGAAAGRRGLPGDGVSLESAVASALVLAAVFGLLEVRGRGMQMCTSGPLLGGTAAASCPLPAWILWLTRAACDRVHTASSSHMQLLPPQHSPALSP